jgi:sucrose-6-phosphate hydrolase SacC (GH32 family)
MKAMYWLLLLLFCSFAKPEKKEKFGYVFGYFLKNGETGLHMAWSEDGLNWQPVKKGRPMVKAAIGDYIIRDPYIFQGKDELFHMVWTSGWNRLDIGYANSKDLITWSPQRLLPVMRGESAALNCWAPEVVYVPEKQQYMIFWSSTIPERFPATDNQASKAPNGKAYNHRIYKSYTTDFAKLTPAELFFDPGFNVIDATIVHDSLGYIMLFKDETGKPLKVQKNIKMATSTTADGKFSDVSEAITGKEWAEGPTIMRTDTSYVLYFDKYKKGTFGALETKDFKTWTDLTDSLKYPQGMRHGTIVKVPQKVLKKLKEVD